MWTDVKGLSAYSGQLTFNASTASTAISDARSATSPVLLPLPPVSSCHCQSTPFFITRLVPSRLHCKYSTVVTFCKIVASLRRKTGQARDGVSSFQVSYSAQNPFDNRSTLNRSRESRHTSRRLVQAQHRRWTRVGHSRPPLMLNIKPSTGSHVHGAPRELSRVHWFEGHGHLTLFQE